MIDSEKIKTFITVFGKYTYYDIQYPIESLDGTINNEIATIKKEGPLTEEDYPMLVSTLIRKRYSADDEFAMDRQSYSDINEYIEYNKYAERCKEIACEILHKTYEKSEEPTFTEVIAQMRIFIKPQLEQVTDDVAITIPALFDVWKKDLDVLAGERYYYKGKLWRCLQSHHTQDETPDENSSLGEEIIKQ